MQAMPSRKEQYAEFLARTCWRGGHHETPVLDVVFAMQGPFDAKDVMAKVEGKASRPTVYRTIARLTEAGLILPVQFNRKSAFVLISPDSATNI
jgi:Fe2+ or Zn2+ uptake regulation protein